MCDCVCVRTFVCVPACIFACLGERAPVLFSNFQTISKPIKGYFSSSFPKKNVGLIGFIFLSNCHLYLTRDLNSGR